MIDVEHFAEHGWLLTRPLDAPATTRLHDWVQQVAADDAVLQSREMTEHGPALCRSENFVPFHDGLRALLTTGAMVDTASALLGEPAVLYKEKINYKLPGGAGYSAGCVRPWVRRWRRDGPSRAIASSTWRENTYSAGRWRSSGISGAMSPAVRTPRSAATAALTG